MRIIRGATFVGLLVLLTVVAGGRLHAQTDLSGMWAPRYHEDQPERIPGPELGDFLGLPITDGARRFAESWDPSRLTLPEHQCRVHTAPYIYRGPLRLRIWEERDPRTQQVVAIKNYINTYEQTRTIWMDGRPHPGEYAPHTWMGFSTGTWEGNTLVVTTTHIKQNWHRRNGLPQSDLATLTEYFIRHGDVLTHVNIVSDPVYLTEPLVKSQNFVRQVDTSASTADGGGQRNWLWPCEIVEEVDGRVQGDVPHYLPGRNPFLTEFGSRFGFPLQVTRGGAEQMYPEYQRTLDALLSTATDADR